MIFIIFLTFLLIYTEIFYFSILILSNLSYWTLWWFLFVFFSWLSWIFWIVLSHCSQNLHCVFKFCFWQSISLIGPGLSEWLLYSSYLQRTELGQIGRKLELFEHGRKADVTVLMSDKIQSKVKSIHKAK